jgi:RimJ/RimL family protein N-acetyltransferase
MTERTLPPMLATPRLRLRPYRLADLDDIVAFADDEAWARYLPGIPWPYAREDGERFLAKQLLLDREVHPTWAIEHDGRCAGGINLRLLDGGIRGAMGWSIARPLWGRGLVTEAARLVRDAAFATVDTLYRLEATADVRNVGSTRIMEKLGMRHEGVRRGYRFHRGEWCDETWYGLLRPEHAALLAQTGEAG